MIEKAVLYFKNSYEELKKVVWPSRQEVASHTIIVVTSIIVSMGLIALLDLGLFNILEILIYKR